MKDAVVKWMHLEDENKKKMEAYLRQMWNECFHDPKHYEDFYFSNVYKKNIVGYISQDKLLGMLHLNPYDCYVAKQIKRLHYIVGVATHSDYRRQGIMRSLLKQSLEKMWDQKEPFTFLMPADAAYYEPFSFVFSQKEKKQEIGITNCIEQNKCANDTDLHISYESFRNLSDMTAVTDWLSEKLKNEYDIVPVRDLYYFNMLYEEKKCQAGDVIFLFDNEKIKGYFSYARIEGKVYLEQFVADSKYFTAVLEYFKNEESLVWMESFSYMIRIVHLESFLQAFEKEIGLLLKGRQYLKIADALLEKNNVAYQLIWNSDSYRRVPISVKQYMDCANDENSIIVSVEELASFIVSDGGIETFFAEVV